MFNFLCDCLSWEKAGKLASNLLKKYSEKIKPDVKMMDIATSIERDMYENADGPAFPVNISLNEFAAHDTPHDNSVFGESLIKLDIGAQINGFLSDTAITIDLTGEHGKLVECAQLALENAISTVRVGVTPQEIGKVIEDTIRGCGFHPIENLSGHLITPWNLHAGISIPNINRASGRPLLEGDVIAIEPFATYGSGRVVEEPRAYIFSFIRRKGVRNKYARNIMDFVHNNFSKLPFAERWISNLVPESQLNNAMNELMRAGVLHSYPVLREKTKEFVAQFEHTVYVDTDAGIVLSR